MIESGQVEMDDFNWSYDPREGFAISSPSLVYDHGHYECLARSNSISDKKQSLGFLLQVQRKSITAFFL